MFDAAATLIAIVATPASAGSPHLLHAAIDPLALFLLGGAGTLFAALCYGIHSSWKDEMAGPHRLYAEEDEAPPLSSAAVAIAGTEAVPTASPDHSRHATKLAS